jgi:hypothetical protein
MRFILNAILRVLSTAGVVMAVSHAFEHEWNMVIAFATFAFVLEMIAEDE